MQGLRVPGASWLNRLRERIRKGPAPTVPWQAPVARGPITEAVLTPGSKSATNRAFVLAALADGPGTIFGALDARDTLLMRQGLEQLGARIELERHPRFDTLDRLRVIPPRALLPGASIDCGLSGTVMRFLPPLAALANGSTRFHGDAQAGPRPLRPLLDALGDLGVEVEPRSLPFTVTGRGGVRGGEITLDSSASSQFISGLLMFACRCTEGLTIRHVGGPLPSRPHVDMTLAMLQDRGVDAAEIQPDVWRVEPGVIQPRDERIETDLMNMAPFVAAVLITGGRAVFPWPEYTAQAADQVAAVLGSFGGDVRVVERGERGRPSELVLQVEGPDRLHGADLDLADVSELTCVAAALAALADGPSRIRGVGHIRGHETDRLAALERELGDLGALVSQTDDGLEITPRKLSGGVFATYADHRMAHAGALLGLVTPGIVLDDISCTTKTMPDFPGLWQQLLAGVVEAR